MTAASTAAATSDPLTQARRTVEDPDLHLHPQTPITVIQSSTGDPVVLVPAVEFMAVQRERDEYHRVLALINAWRLTPHRSEARLVDLLARAGQGDEQGQAMLGLLAWAADPDRE